MPILRSVDDLDHLRNARRRLLAVFPHPDDEAYGCAGALARSGADPDAAIALLCLTRGEASSVLAARGLDRERIGALREGRLLDVARIVGLDALLVPGLPDGRLARLALDELAAVVGAALDALRPHVVIGHDPRGVNGHLDHVATHWAIRHALLARPGVRFAMIAYPREVCDALAPRLLFPTPDAEIDAVLRLSPEETDAKEACLRVHEAIVTLREPDTDAVGDDLIRRPPIERYDLLGEEHEPVLADLFGRLPLTP